MTRLIRYAVLLSLLIWPALVTPTSAQGACQQFLPHGVYEGPTSVMMDIRGYENGMLLQEITYNDTGLLSLTIDCGVTAGTYHWNVYRTIMLVPGTSPVVCQYTVDLSQASGSVVIGANGQPRIDVRWGQGVINPNDCLGPGPAELAATWRFSLGGPPQGRNISGDFRIAFDDPAGKDYDGLAEMFRAQGYEVTLTKGWTMTRKPEPKVKGLSSDLRQFFLAGIPVTNRYWAVIDWDDAPVPGTADFILGGGSPMPMEVAGIIATLELPLGTIQGTGDIPISIEAKLGDRVNRLDGLGPLTLVPVPAWASPFHLQPQIQGDAVRYSGVYALPSKPLDAHVALPAGIPFIGGTWGLLPTQLRLNLAANSLGTREPGSLSAQGGFGLGARTHTLSASGNIFGTLTHDTLNFESDELTLSTPRISFGKSIGLLSVIPDVESLFSMDIIGPAIEAFNSLTSVTADLHGSMTGRGRLGVSGDTLALTEGGFDALLGVGLKAGPDNAILSTTISGGGDGSLKMQVVPEAKVLACRIQLSFGARFSIFSLPPAQAQSVFSLSSCSAAMAQTWLDVTAPRALASGKAYGSPGPIRVEQSRSLAQATNGLIETVLVEDASPDARPVLVVGPSGRVALVWNSVSAAGATNAVSLRFFDGSVWGNVITVNQSNHPAFTPSAAFAANGNLVITWVEAQIAPDPAGLTAAFARSLEIAWGEVDPAAGQVIRRGLATIDNVMDFAPRLSRASDGTVWLTWQSSPGTNLAGSAASPNALKAARWTSSGWTATETVGQNGVGMIFWDIAAVDANRVWLVADVDTDGDLGTATDREIYVYTRTAAGWATPYRLTNNAVLDSGPLLTLTPDGQPVLAWRHEDSVLGLVGDPASAQPQTWFEGSAGVGPRLGGGRLLAGADGTRVLLWADATDRGQDVWLSRFNPMTQVWSSPAPLFDTAEMRRSLSASLVSGGDILLGLAAMPVISQTITFDGGGSAEVPAVGDAARLLVARIPAGYLPTPEGSVLFLPMVTR